MILAERRKRIAKGGVDWPGKHFVIFGFNSTTQLQPKRDITGGIAANQVEVKNPTRGRRHIEEASKTGLCPQNDERAPATAGRHCNLVIYLYTVPLQSNRNFGPIW